MTISVEILLVSLWRRAEWSRTSRLWKLRPSASSGQSLRTPGVEDRRWQERAGGMAMPSCVVERAESCAYGPCTNPCQRSHKRNSVDQTYHRGSTSSSGGVVIIQCSTRSAHPGSEMQAACAVEGSCRSSDVCSSEPAVSCHFCL